jgi:hypothetical protein
MADIIKYWTTPIAALIEATGAIIIVLAAIEAALRAFALFVRRGFPASQARSLATLERLDPPH